MESSSRPSGLPWNRFVSRIKKRTSCFISKKRGVDTRMYITYIEDVPWPGCTTSFARTRLSPLLFCGLPTKHIQYPHHRRHYFLSDIHIALQSCKKIRNAYYLLVACNKCAFAIWQIWNCHKQSLWLGVRIKPSLRITNTNCVTSRIVVMFAVGGGFQLPRLSLSSSISTCSSLCAATFTIAIIESQRTPKIKRQASGRKGYVFMIWHVVADSPFGRRVPGVEDAVAEAGCRGRLQRQVAEKFLLETVPARMLWWFVEVVLLYSFASVSASVTSCISYMFGVRLWQLLGLKQKSS